MFLTQALNHSHGVFGKTLESDIDDWFISGSIFHWFMCQHQDVFATLLVGVSTAIIKYHGRCCVLGDGVRGQGVSRIDTRSQVSGKADLFTQQWGSADIERLLIG